MGRYVLYGSENAGKATSGKDKTSAAFDISPQSPKFGVTDRVDPVAENALNSYGVNSLKNKKYIDYTLENENFSDIRTQLLDTLNLVEETGAQSTFSKYTKYYNRFKLPTLNDAFQKGYAHLFFTRPDCNVLNTQANALNSNFTSDTEFTYAWLNNPDVVKELSLDSNRSHDFMLSLSNKAASFSLSDEYIDTDTYGKTYKGWQVAYGRNNVESKTAKEFNVSFNDDRTLHLYTLNKLWVDYISEVYQGKKSPKESAIRDKILDYAASCYYIVTAEDGETIIFWSKYYGVFPTTIPSTHLAYAQGTTIEPPKMDVTYKFSFKEDMNPEALIEFNMNAKVEDYVKNHGSMKYVPVFDSNLGHVGTTWVGAPYIELVTKNTDKECPYTFKLRFRPK
jgi:hypothetical protein